MFFVLITEQNDMFEAKNPFFCYYNWQYRRCRKYVSVQVCCTLLNRSLIMVMSQKQGVNAPQLWTSVWVVLTPFFFSLLTDRLSSFPWIFFIDQKCLISAIHFWTAEVKLVGVWVHFLELPSHYAPCMAAEFCVCVRACVAWVNGAVAVNHLALIEVEKTDLNKRRLPKNGRLE